MIIGGVVPVVNIKGIEPGALTLDGPTLAAIYLGEIKNWNDARIKPLNPKLALPQLAIAPVYRSDGSGTNFLFTNYLSKASPDFKSKIGANTSVEWPVGIGAKGNEGVADMTTQTGGAHRLRRVRLRQAEPDDLRPHEECGRQGGRDPRAAASRPRRPTPTGPRPRAFT